MMSLILGIMLTSGAMAQDTLPEPPSAASDSQQQSEDEHARPQREPRFTHEQMTEKMIAELKLDEKQTKKISKLNKKYKTLIEGSQPMGMPGQRPHMEKGSRPSGGGFGGGMQRTWLQWLQVPLCSINLEKNGRMQTIWTMMTT